MKNINFVKTISPQEHRRIARWYHITLMLFACSVGYILVIHINQLRALYAAKAEHQELAQQAPSPDVVQKYQKLEQREQELRAQLAEIKTVAATMTNPLEHLTVLQKALAKDATLQACTIAHKKIDMIIACSSAQTAAHYIKTVCKDCASFNALQLTALQPTRSSGNLHFNATIKGMLA